MMRGSLIHHLRCLIVFFFLLLLLLLLLSSFRTSIPLALPLPPDVPHQEPESTSLVPLDDSEPDISTSTQPITQDDAILVAALDGTLSFVEVNSRRILWSLESGAPIYSSYQAPLNLDANVKDAFHPRDDIYMDCGDDWELYEHDRVKGIKKRFKFNAQGFLNITPILSENGSMITGKMTTSMIAIDAKTGTIIWATNPFGAPAIGSASVENPVILKVIDNNVRPQVVDHQQLTITRKDYTFTAHSMLSGHVLWNLTLTEIEAHLSCPVLDASSSPYNLGSENEADWRSAYCLKSILVFRIRDGGHSGSFSAVGSVGGLPGDKALSLPPLEDMNFPFPVHAYPMEYHNGKPYREEVLVLPSVSLPPIEDSNLPVPLHVYSKKYHNSRHYPKEVLALPYAEVVHFDGTSIYDKMRSSYNLWLPVLLFLSLVVGVVHRYVTAAQASRHQEALKSKAVSAKKRKTKKSGVIKNVGNATKLHDGGCSSAEAITTKSSSDSNIQGNVYVDGRMIGKLTVSNIEIAKGSNGTVVLEGIYDGRHVAVKRMVQTHHDVAVKEIQNLIASDQHPNIVRWYGVEFDADFIYISLERCTCNLNDLICLYSGTLPNTTGSEGVDSDFMNDYFIQLQQKMDRDKDFVLWKANGYPSRQLLKLMRDVVAGLVHLHELGIIHRDLKPQNVLIIKDRTFCAKLSDMGISKRLDGDLSSVSHNATGIGSSGWRAPEQLLHGRQSRAVDSFSLGCLLFFCMTGGKHPFGDRLERDVNIVKNEMDLFLVEHIPEAVDVISRLLDPKPERRPKAEEVLHHPLFWSPDIKLSFLRDVSDRVQLEDRKSVSELLKALEGVASSALGGGKWDEKLENAFVDNIGKYRRYKYDSVRDLLRVIRNKFNHYGELPVEIQELLGPVPEGFDSYFTSRFPRLLIEVYRVIYRYCREEELLSKYFNSLLI
ncbi:hypothetical protein Dimus_023609 [Dionaea muscipula]